MKKVFAITLASSIFFLGCKQDLEKPADWTSVAVIDASPVPSTNPSDTLHVFVDGARYNSTGILYTAGNTSNPATTYIPIVAGTKTFDIRRGTASTSSKDFANYVNSFSYTLERGGAYSFFVYDTTTSATSSDAKVLRLKDDLTLPGNNSNVRFLHLAPKGPAVDVTLLRTSVTPNDSVTIATNKSYVGASPNETALAPFTSVPRGTYTAKVKAAGTQTVLTTLSVTLTNGADIAQGRIVTLYLTGTAKGRPLALGSFRHY